MPRLDAVMLGAREVGFTVLSISLSLIAVFTPILFMGGIPGRFFREFALTLSIAILISLVISLTTTPMLCALLLRPKPGEEDGAKKETDILRPHACRLRAHAGPGALASSAGHADFVRRDRAERLSADHRAQGLFSTAGYRAHHGRVARRPVRLVPGHAKEARGDDRHHAPRSGCGKCHRLHGRRQRRQRGGAQHRVGLCESQAARRAQSLRRRNHRTLAAEAGAAAGRGDFSHRHPGFSRRRAPEQRRISIHLAWQWPRTVFLDAEAGRGLAARPRASRRKFGPAAEGAGVGCPDRSRHRLSAGAQRGAD